MTDENVTILPPTIRAAGDPRPERATWILMPVDTSDGRCSQCAVRHEPEMPHDKQSLAYQYSFYAEHDRWPDWKDAMAHCDQPTQDVWMRALTDMGVEI